MSWNKFTSSIPGIVFTPRRFNVLCRRLSSVVAVLCGTFFFLQTHLSSPPFTYLSHLLTVPLPPVLTALDIRFNLSRSISTPQGQSNPPHIDDRRDDARVLVAYVAPLRRPSARRTLTVSTRPSVGANQSPAPDATALLIASRFERTMASNGVPTSAPVSPEATPRRPPSGTSAQAVILPASLP